MVNPAVVQAAETDKVAGAVGEALDVVEVWVEPFTPVLKKQAKLDFTLTW